MGFLQSYTSLYSGDQRKALLTEWVFQRRQELFAELRHNAPFLQTQDFVMVSRHEDVKALFEDFEHFNVKAYLGSFDFVLGKDKADDHDVDRTFLEGLIPQAELERVHQVTAGAINRIYEKIMARYTGNATLPGGHRFRAPAGRIDIPSFVRPISVAVAQHYFGFTDPKPADFGIPPLPHPPYPVPEPIEDPRPLLDPTFPCVANWIATLNGAFIHGAFGRHFTFDPVAIQQLVARVPQVRKEVGMHIAMLIQGFKRQPPARPTTILQKMVVAEKPDPALSAEEHAKQLVEKVTRNLVGMVNGMVDNVTSAVSNAVDFFLSHPSAQEMATEVAQTVIPAGQPGADSAENQGRRRQLWEMIREALRFNAPVPFLLRIANEDLVLAPGTVRETHVAKGTILFLSVCSAMMDEQKWEQPLEFRPDRPWADADDLIFGTGWHDCFGKYIAQAQIIEMMRALLTLQNFRRAPGRLGKLEYGMFFPKQLAVDFGPKPIQTALTAIMEIKQPYAFHAQALKLILSQAYQRVVDVLDRVGTVHFARFVFLENDTKLALMTSYDGSFDTYMKNYIEVAGDLFNLMLAHIKDAPPLPVRRYRDEFIAYVEKIDLVSDSQFYSAYGDLTVQDILGMQEGGKEMNAATSIVVTKKSLMNPPLPLQDIQGLILCDYGLPAVRHFFVRVDHPEGGRRLVHALVTNPQTELHITTAAEWTSHARLSFGLNMGFTYPGLQALCLPAATLASFAPAKAFTSGAAERAALIGDCGESAPQHWRGQLNSRAVHVMCSLYAEKAQLEALSTSLVRLARKHACTIIHHEDGAALEENNSQNENLPGVLIHFGYRDGIAQPVIEGAPNPRYAAPNPTFVAPGALLLGHPSQWIGFQYPVPRPLEFGRNGSFAAFRILQQDVVGFEKYLTEAAPAAKLDREMIAAKICGRWRNGAPLTPKTQSAMPTPPPDDQLNNFTFTDDPQGLACPFDAHIRRTNPRNEAVAGADGDRHPLVRRGMPYGPKYDPQNNTNDNCERGLLGLFICASIEDQFEFLMTNWMNRGGFRPELTSKSKDLIAGNNTLGDTAFQLPTASGKLVLPTFANFVTTRGAAYCFLPSMTGLKYIADL